MKENLMSNINLLASSSKGHEKPERLHEIIEEMQETAEDMYDLIPDVYPIDPKALARAITAFAEWQVVGYGRDAKTRRVVTEQLWSEVQEHVYSIIGSYPEDLGATIEKYVEGSKRAANRRGYGVSGQSSGIPPYTD